MNLSLRFVVPLVLILSLFAYGVVPLVDNLTFKWFIRDLDIRAKLVTATLQETLIPLVQKKSKLKILALLNRVSRDERIYAIAFCFSDGKLMYKTPSFPEQVYCHLTHPLDEGTSTVLDTSQGPFHLAYQPLGDLQNPDGELIIVHDMSFIRKRSNDTKKYIFLLFIVLATIISLITLIIAQLSWKGWIRSIRSLLRGDGLIKPISQVVSSELRPIVTDLGVLLKNLEYNRNPSSFSESFRDESRVSWSPKALKEILNQQLAGDEVLIVSNREPYMHIKNGDQTEILVPASGVVTALEPIMRACSGTWIAHGSGSADREVVDKYDRVRVPPGDPSYQIRRVWLTKEEEAGYYFGFSNEGLWPLCHIAHVRPTFRTEDWTYYAEVNQKFADAVIEEAKTENPVILVQDYHFALLPKMVKKRLPKATIITFWHIPWPNPEAFGICPWREELLDGLLGSSIVGFHTRFHCNNFYETVDRFLECRIDHEASHISYKGDQISIKHYPISIEYPARWMNTQKSIQDCRQQIRNLNGLPQDRLLGIGVDRLDYTKGILERFLSVEKLLEQEPGWIGKFTFIQIASPSRSTIDQYQRFSADVEALAARINLRFAQENYHPILLKIEHHRPEEVYQYFRGAQVCFVSSLHDGMNLVAKEFVAARDDEAGVLILSQFTGASRELLEALLVNPYNIDQCALALHIALEMPAHEQRDRMRSMRSIIQEFNVYRWAGRMLIDAARIRRRSKLRNRLQRPFRKDQVPDLAYRL